MSSTKGLGPFFNVTWKDFRSTNAIGDIQGTSASSLKKAPVSQRQTNPLTPDYQIPGAVEYAGTTRHALDRIGSSCPPKPQRQVKNGPPKDQKPQVDF